MKLAVFEPEGGGHRMVLYVRHIEDGWQLKLFTSQRAIDNNWFGGEPNYFTHDLFNSDS